MKVWNYISLFKLCSFCVLGCSSHLVSHPLYRSTGWSRVALVEPWCGVWIWMTSVALSVAREHTPWSTPSKVDWELELVCMTHIALVIKLMRLFPALIFSLISTACSARANPLPPVTPTQQAPPQPAGGGSSSSGSSSSGSSSTGSGFCAGKADGLYPDPSNQNDFYHCNQGNTYVQHCATGLMFDNSCKCCNWA